MRVRQFLKKTYLDPDPKTGVDPGSDAVSGENSSSYVEILE
jgi:hypothetical protein